jgi:GxxExxY protein
MVVVGAVVVEVKAVEHIIPLHQAQLLTYLRLGAWKAGLPINFNVPVLRDGIVRRILALDEEQD